MTLTTLYHDSAQNTAGGQLRQTQVEWINMHRMRLCPLSTGINYRSPTEDFQYMGRIFRHMTRWNSLHGVIIRNITVLSTSLSPQILTFGVFPNIKTVLRIQCEDLHVCTVQHFLLFQLMHTHYYKIIEMLKQFKIVTLAPACFGSRRNHHQGTVLCLAKTTNMAFLCSSV